MKTAVQRYFDNFLDMMEPASLHLSKEEFRELEEKIKAEIAHHRGNAIGFKKTKVGKKAA